MHQDSWTARKEIGQFTEQGITTLSILTGEIPLVNSPLDVRNQPPLAIKIETILHPAIGLNTGAKIVIMRKAKSLVFLVMEAGQLLAVYLPKPIPPASWLQILQQQKILPDQVYLRDPWPTIHLQCPQAFRFAEEHVGWCRSIGF